jgi:hypothetical protein
MTTTSQHSAISAGLNLELMERCLTNTIYGDSYLFQRLEQHQVFDGRGIRRAKKDPRYRVAPLTYNDPDLDAGR